MNRSILALAFIFIFAASAIAQDAGEILKKVDRNLNPAASQMYRRLINVEPDGSKKEFVLWTAKKGKDKMVAVFLDPPSEKGRSTLRLGDNMWLYIPNVGKPMRITSLQSIVGGVFNNSDILRLDFADEYSAESLEDKGDHYLLNLKAKTRSVAYDQLAMKVDKKTLAPIEIECRAATGMLIKTLYYKQIKDFGNGIVRPAVLETDSPLHKGYKSIMLFLKVEPKELKDEAFSLNFMPRVEELRQ